MICKDSIEEQHPLRKAMTDMYRMDEVQCLQQLLPLATLPETSLQRIKTTAYGLVEKVRAKRLSSTGLDAFLHQYDLSTEEGIALMCIAEALLRIPDKETADRLIQDKVAMANWQEHAGRSHSMFVNAATWGLMLTGRFYQWSGLSEKQMTSSLKGLMKRGGDPLIRNAVSYAMKILGKQFVMGRTIEEAVKRAVSLEKQGYRYSYDMLGEAARTEADAERYCQAYHHAIEVSGRASNGAGVIAGPGVSIKLSALYPRYEFAKRDDVFAHLVPRLLKLAVAAKEQNIGLTIDAEEADRLDLSLDVIEKVFSDPALNGWEGFGLAVQAYQKRALPVIHWLADLSKRYQRRIMIRLIKGAYWDSEIKVSQESGFAGYPVFTRKSNTDVSYLACAKTILDYGPAFYPMFATHNAYSVAAILEMVGVRRDFEFQCLHGMGQPLYDEIVGKEPFNHPCRIYAPVGSHEDLLAYLVRRLLENGANSSFVNRIVDASQPIEQLIVDPVAQVEGYVQKTHPGIALPINLYGHSRANSKGLDFSNWQTLSALKEEMQQAVTGKWQAGPIIDGVMRTDAPQPVRDPADTQRIVGQVTLATAEDVTRALDIATAAEASWDATPVETRAQCLDNMANLMEQHHALLMAMAVREAGKTLPDAVAEVREAVDFCRYYAAQAREHFATPQVMQGPTGELNQLSLHGRGVMCCISPWNFPLAIFLGQVSAALVAGNPVIAKPAEQTALIAALAVQLFHQAGIPPQVLQYLPGRGEVVGAALVADPRVKGVMFTGSTETARSISQSLAHRPGPIVPFIAETGGQNVMIVDSSALPEQIVVDVIRSAFGSAGQRCSALRVLFVQDVVADKVLRMLQGAMAELHVGDPALLVTDIGPVIDEDAKNMLQQHLDVLKREGTLLYQVALPKETQKGFFIPPTAYEIASLSMLKREVFGPILHVIRYSSQQLPEVIDAVNNTGYGLTLGIHSRIQTTVQQIVEGLRVGNTYVNRNMIGAVVGVQPFGGEGLSGTGPKAGGPHYLFRLCTERTLSINTTAAGGNASLMSLVEED
jgi:RHH-type proline utilization regulon transcriptional repressor/proline dehydrogenase/delta 1-pyrroline-5-carboxylate dehydrogenase